MSRLALLRNTGDSTEQMMIKITRIKKDTDLVIELDE